MWRDGWRGDLIFATGPGFDPHRGQIFFHFQIQVLFKSWHCNIDHNHPLSLLNFFDGRILIIIDVVDGSTCEEMVNGPSSTFSK